MSDDKKKDDDRKMKNAATAVIVGCLIHAALGFGILRGLVITGIAISWLIWTDSF